MGALAFVLYPLFYQTPGHLPSPARPRVVDSEEQAAIAELRELELDRATGKLSEPDYAELKARYTKTALAAMRRANQAPAPGEEPTDAELEAHVLLVKRRLAGCATCGPRPESDAVYCSNCGRYLSDRCATCGAPVVALEARYCNSCGNRLAA